MTQWKCDACGHIIVCYQYHYQVSNYDLCEDCMDLVRELIEAIRQKKIKEEEIQGGI